MSGETVVGHVSWSPDYKSQDSKIQKLLDAGRVKLAPHWSGDKLVSVDLVAVPPTEPVVEPEATDVRPHRANVPTVLLVGPETESPEMVFTYKNWKGVTSQRRAVFTSLWWGANEWHPEPQLLVRGVDLDKNEARTFAVRDISDLRPA